MTKEIRAFIREMRKMGASRVQVNGIIVEFPAEHSRAEPTTVSSQDIFDQIAKEVTEALSDERETQSEEAARKRRKTMNRLKYAHAD